MPPEGYAVIYNRQTIALLMRLCKLASGEFGVRLHLNDPEIINKISDLLSDGASPEILSVWSAVRDEIGLELLPATEEARRPPYRGQASPSPSIAPEPVLPPATRPRSVRIYRGRIVTG